MPAFTLHQEEGHLREAKRGKCAKRKVTKTNIFWFTQAGLPAERDSSASRRSTATRPTPDETKTIEIPCPKFAEAASASR